MKVVVGDERGQLKAVDLTRDTSHRWRHKMDRGSAVSALCWSGQDDTYQRRESEVTVGRVDGTVAAFDVDINQTKMSCLRHFKLVGRIVFLSMFPKAVLPQYEDHLIAVSSLGEVVVTRWRKKHPVSLSADWEVDARQLIPFPTGFFEDVDFRSYFTETDGPTRIRDPGLDEVRNFFDAEAKELIFNQSIQDEECKRPGWLVHAYKLDLTTPPHPEDQHYQETVVRSASLDMLTGRPRLLMAGRGMGLVMLDIPSGKPLFASRPRGVDALNIPYTGSFTCCGFGLPFLDGNLLIAGTENSEVLVFHPKAEPDAHSDRDEVKNIPSDHPNVLRYDRTPRLVRGVGTGHAAMASVVIPPAESYDASGKAVFHGWKCSSGRLVFATFDALGAGTLWKFHRKKDDPAVDWAPPETKRTKMDVWLWKEREGLRVNKAGFPFDMEPVRGFHHHLGSVRAAAFHPSLEFVAVASHAAAIWTYPLGRGTMRHISTTTVPVSQILVSGEPVVDPDYDISGTVHHKHSGGTRKCDMLAGDSSEGGSTSEESYALTESDPEMA